MKKELYYCDKCGGEITDTRDTCVNVKIELRYPDRYYETWQSEQSKNYELCFECAKIIGLKRVQKEERKLAVPSVENKLYELLQDLGVKFDN